VQVRHLGDRIGELEVDNVQGPIDDHDRRLLSDLSGPAGLAMSTVRLTWSLRARIASLEAVNAQLRRSQERLIGARLTAREQLQAEIEDRVLPYLRAVAEAVAGMAASVDDARAPDGAAVAAQRLSVALDALRTIARGIFPPRLGEADLEVCLHGWVETIDVPTSLQVTGDTAALATHADTETCVYFCLVSAMQAAVAAGATAMSVEVVAESPLVSFRLAVQGVQRLREALLTGVTDRVEAFGGRLDVRTTDVEFVLMAWMPLQQTSDDVAMTVTSAATPPGLPAGRHVDGEPAGQGRRADDRR
jgi:signal transduction histidine kinase